VDGRFEADTLERLNVSLAPAHLCLYALVIGQNPVKSVAKSLLPVELRQPMREGFMSHTDEAGANDS
jgi:hypothetical protein